MDDRKITDDRLKGREVMLRSPLSLAVQLEKEAKELSEAILEDVSNCEGTDCKGLNKRAIQISTLASLIAACYKVEEDKNE